MKAALITGAAGGIGSAIAEKFLEKGVAVVGMDVADAARIGHTRLIYVKGDIRNADDRAALIEAALAAHGHIDILVNAAGVAPTVRADLLDMSEESYDRVNDINAKGLFFLTQAVARQMLKNEGNNRGSIVNISSMSAYTSSVSRGEYCISKAGVSMITSLFADRLADEGIAVNEIRPGIIRTGMTAAVKEKYDRLIEGGLLPISRWGEPEDIACAAWALASGELPYMTGQALNVDGGFHIRRL